MNEDERLDFIENTLKRMSAEEIDVFICSIYLAGEGSGNSYNWGCGGTTYSRAFEDEVE